MVIKGPAIHSQSLLDLLVGVLTIPRTSVMELQGLVMLVLLYQPGPLLPDRGFFQHQFEGGEVVDAAGRVVGRHIELVAVLAPLLLAGVQLHDVVAAGLKAAALPGDLPEDRKS